MQGKRFGTTYQRYKTVSTLISVFTRQKTFILEFQVELKAYIEVLSEEILHCKCKSFLDITSMAMYKTQYNL